MYIDVSPKSFRNPYRVKCKFCEKGDFKWQMTGNGWRLFDSEGNQHNCLKSQGRFVTPEEKERQRERFDPDQARAELKKRMEEVKNKEKTKKLRKIRIDDD